MHRFRRAAPRVVIALAFLVSIGLAAALAARVHAATVLRLELADLAARCDLAIEARVTSCSASIDGSGRIATDYALTVERTFAGAALPQRTVRIPGGVLPDGRGLLIPGMPRLAVGETAILFLSSANPRGERVPVGLAQGRLRVLVAPDGTRSIESDLAGLELVDADGRPLPQPAPSPARMSYATTVQRIQTECARRAEQRRAGDRTPATDGKR